MTIESAFINAILADACYVNGLLPNQSGIDLADALSGRMTPTLASFIGANFTVVDQATGYPSSFEATVWRGNAGTPYAGQVYISMRGTQEGPDLTSDADLATNGLAHLQLADLVNWWMRETTPTGFAAQQVGINEFGRYYMAPPVLGTGTLSNVIQITSVNGHSLGGYLATAFARLFGGKWRIASISTFNSAGFNRLAGDRIEQGFSEITYAIGSQLGLPQFSAAQNNYYAQNGINVTTNSWNPIGFMQYGNRVGLFQEDGVQLANGGITNHFMYKLTDLLYLGYALAKLDSKLSFEMLSSLVRTASNMMEASYEGLLDSVRNVLGCGPAKTSVGDSNGSIAGQPASRIEYESHVADMIAYGTFSALQGHVTLSVATGGIAGQARVNFGSFLSLYSLSPVVLSADATGQEVLKQANLALARLWNADLAFTFAQRAAGLATFSDQYLRDRQTLLVGMVAHNLDDSNYAIALRGTVAPNYIYQDLASGAVILFRGTAWNASGQSSQHVTFGDQNDNVLVGADASAKGFGDRLYGGAGNDSLTGLAGEDLLDGGLGDDTLVGGSDGDELFGGAGRDTYVFSDGWGIDKLTDADDSGNIVLDGQTLPVAHANGEAGTWLARASDGTVLRFRVQDSSASVTGKQIVITKQGDENDSITVNNFSLQLALSSQGYLGVKLDASPKIAVTETMSSVNFWSDEQASLNSLVGQKSVLGSGKMFVVSVSQAFDTARQLLVSFLGLNDGHPEIITGDHVLPADGAIITLAPGQTEVHFALYCSTDNEQFDSGQLSVELRDSTDTLAMSNIWGVEMAGVKGAVSSLSGDFTKKSWDGKYLLDATGNYIPDDKSPSSPGAADLLTGSAESDHLQGLAGNDALFGKAGDDSLEGGDGVDVLEGGLGADTLNGGAGNDLIYGSSTGGIDPPVDVGSEIYYAPGTILARGFGWNVTDNSAAGGDGRSAILLSDSVLRDEEAGDEGNVIDAGDGNDEVYAGTGDDRVDAGEGDDLVWGMGGEDLLFGDDGDDYILGDGVSHDPDQYVNFTALEDHGADFIDGGDGEDTLIGQGGDDVVYGGMGSDAILGDDTDFVRTPATVAGDDYLDGEEGDDTLVGGGKDDTLYGGSGADQLWGDGGHFMPADAGYLDPSDQANDYLDGEEDNDTLIGQSGNDTLYGGDGDDMLQGDDHSATRLPGQYNGEDYLDGEDGKDTLLGGGGDDTLYGGSGDDLVEGDDDGLDAQFHGSDYLEGEDGDDTLVGGGADDTLYGGAGDDLLMGDGRSAGKADFDGQFSGDDEIDGEEGNDTIYGGGGDDTLSGSEGNDLLYADGNGAAGDEEGDDWVDGGDGADTLYGAGGDDTLIGGDGADVLRGEAGDDSLDGGDGNDTLYADMGDDTLVGGDGDNVYVIQAGEGDISIDSSSDTDVIRFADGTNLDDVQGSSDDTEMLLDIGSRTITVTGSPIFQFADGTRVDAETLSDYLQAHPIFGTTTLNLQDGLGNPAGSEVTRIDANGTMQTIFSGQDGTGNKEADYWSTPDGSYGNDSYYADGSSAGLVASEDGSYQTYSNDGAGKRITNNYDVLGGLIGSSVRTSVGGTITNTSYSGADGSGSKTGDSWSRADGTSGGNTYHDDGSSDGYVHYADGTASTYTDDGVGNWTRNALDAGGFKTGDSWTHSDGSHGSDTFYRDGSSTGIAYSTDGSYATYTNDGHGHVTTLSFDAQGRLVPTQTTTKYADGSYLLKVDDGQGNVTFTLYSAQGVVISKSWVNADGTHGEVQYRADGSSTSTTYRVDGSYSVAVNDGHGTVVTSNYTFAGALEGSSIAQANGLNAITTSKSAGGVVTGQTWVDADGTTGTVLLDPHDFGGANHLVGTAHVALSGYEPWSNKEGTASGRYDGDTTYGFSSDWWIYQSDGDYEFRMYSDGSKDGAFHMNFAGYHLYDYYANAKYVGPLTSSNRNVFGEFQLGNDKSGLSFYADEKADGSVVYTAQAIGSSALLLNTTTASAQVAVDFVLSRNGYREELKGDGAGNFVLYTFNSAGVLIGDAWLHNNGSNGIDILLADGSWTGEVSNADGTVDAYTRSVSGQVTRANFPGPAGVPYPAPPQAPAQNVTTTKGQGAGSDLSKDHQTTTGGGAGSGAGTGAGWTPSVTSTIVYINLDTGSSLVDTDPGYSQKVVVNGVAHTWTYAPGGQPTSSSRDDGHGNVVTYAYGATGQPASRTIAVTSTNGSITTTTYDMGGHVIGSAVRTVTTANQITTVTTRSSGPTGTLTGSTVQRSDGQGNAVVATYDAAGQCLGYTVSVATAGNQVRTTTYDAQDACMSVQVATLFTDGTAETDYYDRAGRLTSSVVAKLDSRGNIQTAYYDGSQTLTSYATSNVASNGDRVTVTFDAKGNRICSETLSAAGTQTSISYGGDGSSVTTVTSLDQSYTVTARSALGDAKTTQYTSQGVRLSDTWTRADGSHGTDAFASDGSSTGQANYADGSSATFVTTVAGKQTATERNASGTVTGTVVTTVAGGKTGVTRFNTAGTKLTERWWSTDGSYGSTDWTDPALIRTESHAADGSYAVTTDDRKGNVTTTQFSVAGAKLGDTWTKADGSHGSDTYNADGSSVSIAFTATGTATRTVSDGAGDVTTITFDTSGMRVRDTWTRADGSHGTDTFAIDGTVSGTRVNADGTTTSFSGVAAKPSVAAPIADQTARQGVAWTLPVGAATFFEPDAGDMLTYSATKADGTALPAWLSFNAKTQTFTGTPPAGSIGAIDLKVTVSDMIGLSVSDVFRLTVTSANGAPTVSQPIGAQAATEDAPWSFQFAAATFSDPDAGDLLSYSASLADGSALPTWLHFDASSRTFSGTPTNSEVGDVGIRVTATDSHGLQATNTFTVSIANVNDAPAVDQAIGDRSTNEDSLWQLTVPVSTFADVDAGDTLHYSATRADGGALPSWLTFDPATRTFSGTPANDDVGALGLAVVATDAAGATATARFVLTVINVNDPPVVSQPVAAQSTLEDAPWSFVVPAATFVDVDPGDSLVYLATRADGSPLPAWLSFNASTRTFSGTPSNDDVGDVSLTIKATDSAGAATSASFTLTVVNVNDRPIVVQPIASQSAYEDSVWSFAVPVATFRDIDISDKLTYSAALAGGGALPAWLRFDPSTMTFTGTPTNDDVGKLSLAVSATDLAGTSVTTSFGLTVINVNDAPVPAQPVSDQQTVKGTAWTFALPAGVFTDPDLGDALTYSARYAGAAALPSWLKFDALTRTFSGTATAGDTGVFGVEVIATDKSGVSASQTFTLTVANPVGNTPFMGTVGADSLVGSFGADRLDGLLGNDTLRGLSGDDTLSGGDGADDLYGGSGNDYLDGGKGGDHYFFGRGDGQDTIFDVDNTPGAEDVLTFGNGIAADQLWLRRVNTTDLEVSVIGTTDKVTISGWYTDSNHHIEVLQLSNGQKLLDTQVQNLVQAMASFAPPPIGQVTLSTNYQGQLEPLIAANWR